MINKWENPWGMERQEILDKWAHVIEQTMHCYTWTSADELSFLAELASRSDKILEIGSYHGKSALVMSLANPKATIVCIDVCMEPGIEETFSKNLSKQISDNSLLFVKGTSEWLKDVPIWQKFNISFIDGGHLYPDVKADIANTIPHMAPGSIICGHDYRINDPKDGINVAVHEAFNKAEIRLYQSIWWVQLP